MTSIIHNLQKEANNMMKKFRKIHWLVALLVLGLAIGFIVGCGDDDDDDGDGTPQLSVELEWASAVDIDLEVTEPTGQLVWGGPGDNPNGPTATSIGDNTCGFGSECLSANCTDLPCGSRERIYAQNVAIGGRYTISVDSFSTADENVALFITVPSDWVEVGNAYYLRVDCVVPAGSNPVLAYADFPASGSAMIGAEIAQVECAVTDQSFR
jgi:hypothetical protein